MRPTLRENLTLLRKIEADLKAAHILSPEAEAETLITHFSGVRRLDFFTGEKKITLSARRSIQKALTVRKKGKPLFYLTGEAPFYGRLFRVTPDTLIPRPETEVLVEKTLDLLKTRYEGKTADILDLGTGTGCIAVSLTLEHPDCRMTALDASPEALRIARKNLDLFDLRGRIRLVQSRLFDAFDKDKRRSWDIIVSNPPYVPREGWKKLSREVRSEPRLALDGGPRGLRVVEKILDESPAFLASGGWLLMEIGDGQSVFLEKRLRSKRTFARFDFIKDLNGIDRVLVAQKHG